MKTPTFSPTGHKGPTHTEACLPHEAVGVGQCLEDQVQQVLWSKKI